MEEFINDLLLAVGGGVGVALIFLGLFKNVVQKWIESTIDKVADKKLAKYSNSLTRKTMAYDLLLKKEFDFYEKTSKYTSDMSKNMAEFIVYTGILNPTSLLVNEEEAEKVSLLLIEDSVKFTQELMVNSAFVPDNILDTAQELVETLTRMQLITCEVLISLSHGCIDDKNKKETLDNQEAIDRISARLMTLIKYRLIELSE